MSILSTIMGVESSGGHNVTQGNIGDINNRTGDLAQGYYQITGGTWAEFGGGKTGYSSAITAPYATQLQVAQNIPVSRWGPNAQAQLRANGYQPQPGETLGAMLTRYGENPAATIPADGASPTGSGDIIAHGPVDQSSGLGAGPNTRGTADIPGTGIGGGPNTATTDTGKQVQVGIQPGLFGDIQNWLNGIAQSMWSGVSTSFTAMFGDIQNWFIRAFLIIVGIVVLAIGLLKITGTDKIVIDMAKEAAVAA